VLVVATVASLVKTRGEVPEAEGTAIDPAGTDTGEPGRPAAITEDEQRARAAAGDQEPRRR
jgi:tellurite resistance protein TerC